LELVKYLVGGVPRERGVCLRDVRDGWGTNTAPYRSTRGKTQSPWRPYTAT